ncbi:hypothetical protein [Verrucomicrobium spinosum]|uniref:hypothetical protein n=1 Tax=Verrucomicrobium spinosum TaxID=2736 RepID=UPI003CCD3163
MDIAPLAVDRARSLDAGQGVQYVLASLFDLPEELRGKFDLVWEHTCLCALDPALRKAISRAWLPRLKSRAMWPACSSSIPRWIPAKLVLPLASPRRS